LQHHWCVFWRFTYHLPIKVFCAPVEFVRVLVSCKCPFPIRGAAAQRDFGVAGTSTSLAGLSGFLELSAA
jgi:hypothetical protein